MGLLDDAIREHLDLKRRRGADPAEIERAEREALGPVRRNREPGTVEDHESLANGDLDPALDEPGGGIATDLVDEPDTGEEHYAVDEEPGFDERGAYVDDDENPFAEEQRLEEDDEPAAGDDPFADEDDPHRTQVMSTVDIPAPEDATRAHDVEAAFADEDEDDEEDATGEHELASHHDPRSGDDEDVLEETPEFLQDTPDHDRLWFEQRPPSDFDFDG